MSAENARAYALGSGRGGRTSAAQVMHRAAIVTDRYRVQNERQKESITRLLQNPDAATEITRLQGELASADAVLNHINELHMTGDDGNCVECGKPSPCPTAVPFADKD